MLRKPPHEIVDGCCLQLVTYPVGDETRRRVEDLLALDESILTECLTSGHEINDSICESHERGELNRAIHLDDLRLTTRALKPRFGHIHVLRCHPHHTEALNGGRCRVIARHCRPHHPAGAEPEVEQLVHIGLPLQQHVAAHDSEVGRAALDVHRHVGRAGGDVRGPIRAVHNQLAAEIQQWINREPGSLKRLKRLIKERSPRHADGQIHGPSSSEAIRVATPSVTSTTFQPDFMGRATYRSPCVRANSSGPA